MADIKLDKIDTKAPAKIDKEKIKAKLSAVLQELNELQNILYAQSKYAVLVVIQGLDASGKDGLIRHCIWKYESTRRDGAFLQGTYIRRIVA
jgi:polyphosphate kinase 2 (PPK2 family)